MQITKVGDSFIYLYNCKTQKLQSTDGREDALVKWFNGEMQKEDLPQEVNEYDCTIKEDLVDLFAGWKDATAWTKEMVEAAEQTQEEEDDIFEIEIHIENPMRTVYKVNGKEAFISECALDMIADDLEDGNYPYPAMIHSEHCEYNKEQNSIGVAVGDQYEIGNGRIIIFHENGVEIQGGTETDSEEKKNYYEKMKDGIEKFFYAEKSDWLSGIISRLGLQEAMDFLGMLGIDTEKDFQVNGAKYYVKGKEIQESQYTLHDGMKRKTYYASLELLNTWKLESLNPKYQIQRERLG